jgi:large subunit ribosomal protein L6
MEKLVDIPEGIEVKKEGNFIAVKGPKGELKREFLFRDVEIVIEGQQVKVFCKNDRRKVTSVVGTWAAHLRNMITGVEKGWISRMKVVYSHFPTKIKAEGGFVIIENFMGERRARKTRIVGDTKVDIKKDDIVLTGINKEDVGQTAGNMEQVTKVVGYDKRVFQDGAYITEKPHPQED